MFNRRWLTLVTAGCMLGLFMIGQPTAWTSVDAQPQPAGAATQIDILMSEFSFQVAGQPENAPLILKAGQAYELIIRDSGVVAHEVVIGQNIVKVDGKPHGYERNLLEAVNVVLRHSESEEFAARVTGLVDLEVQKSHELTIEFTLPESLKGEWEIGCFFAGHYQAGMKLPLIVE